VIIVDGPDGSGKSTVIQNLGHTAVHLKALRDGAGGRTPEGIGDGRKGWGGSLPAVQAYKAQLTTRPPLTGFDRFHLSEVVYGPILRGTQELHDAELTELTQFIHDQQIVVILCLPPFTTTVANIKQHGRERPGYQTLTFLANAYRAFQRLTPWATIVYDYTCDQLPEILPWPSLTESSNAPRIPGA
jgi:hypothetical protein